MITIRFGQAEGHVHGGFFAEEGGLMVDVDICAVPASVSKRYSA